MGKHADVCCGETTLWRAPGGSLYRVVQRLDPARFETAPRAPPGGSRF
ncbi:hypothetical protein ACIQVK_19180 [Streptomyces sp. NPDC090493]